MGTSVISGYFSPPIFEFSEHIFWAISNGRQKFFPQPNGTGLITKADKANYIGSYHQYSKLVTNSNIPDVLVLSGDAGAFQNAKELGFARKGKVRFIASGVGGGLNDHVLIADIQKRKFQICVASF